MGRPARALIDLKALKQNLELAKGKTGKARTIAVVKSDAYGHGLVPVARNLKNELLAVACVEEGVALRQNRLDNAIMVLEGPFALDCCELAQQHNLKLVLHDFYQIRLLQQFNSRHLNLDLWLKIDTGMHRLGFSPESVPEALAQIDRLDQVRLNGVMTHFASADEANDQSALYQLDVFNRIYDQLGRPELLRSVANSGGIFNYPQSHFDRVRPGIMLYGASPSENRSALQHGLQAVMTLESAVMSIRKIAQGDAVGYGCTWRAPRDSVIAQIAIGYGDGYPRTAGNGTQAAVSGRPAPLVGRVSMDMLSVDVTDLPGVKIGDPVELWGKQIPVDEVARSVGTIGYELLTGITARVPRIYI